MEGHRRTHSSGLFGMYNNGKWVYYTYTHTYIQTHWPSCNFSKMLTSHHKFIKHELVALIYRALFCCRHFNSLGPSAILNNLRRIGRVQPLRHIPTAAIFCNPVDSLTWRVVVNGRVTELFAQRFLHSIFHCRSLIVRMSWSFQLFSPKYSILPSKNGEDTYTPLDLPNFGHSGSTSHELEQVHIYSINSILNTRAT